jgi:hypothetical protein
LPAEVETGDHIKMMVQASVGEIAVTARVIRAERNWLMNKTTVGLEFTEVPAESVEKLDKLLVLLGGKPRHPESEDSGPATTKTGLSAWISSANEARGKFVGTGSDTAATEAGKDLDNTDDKQELN